MMKFQRYGAALGLCLLSVLAGPVRAQSSMEPGLWENSVQMSSPNYEMDKAMAQAQAAMASMSPAQRKQMEAALAQHGVALGARPNVIRICVSKAQADMQQLPAVRHGCTQNTQRNGNTIQMTFNCPGNPSSSGQGQVTFSSPKAYAGDFNFTTTSAKGQTTQMQMKQTGTWLSSDCGGLKPMPTTPNR